MRIACVAIAVLLSTTGCTSTKPGPDRPYTIEDEIAFAKPLLRPDLTTFYDLLPTRQAETRNQVLTARMYAADVEFHYYEARLTRESQEEGLGATLSSLGLTTAATLVGGAETKAVLSGAASAVIGADKAYSERQLLSNTVQALQTQMRADRKAQAAIIYAKMFRDTGPNTRMPTPIAEYTLPMALSDAEAYYQAGTIASALVGLSRTLADAERNADQAKFQAGPNREMVSSIASIAAPEVDLSAPTDVDPGIGAPGSGQRAPRHSVEGSQGQASEQLRRGRATLVAIRAKMAENSSVIRRAATTLDTLKQANDPKTEPARQELQAQIDEFTKRNRSLMEQVEAILGKL